MYGKTTFAIVGAFLSFASAVPMNKRDMVWVTMTQEDIVTIPVTKTVWLEPGEETAAASLSTSAVAHYGHGHGHNTKATSTVHATVTVKPIASPEESAAPSTYEAPTTSTYVSVAPTSSSTSEYVAPPPSSTSVYVAPPTSSTSVYIAPSSSSTFVYVTPTTSPTSIPAAPTTSSTSEHVAPPATSTYVAPATTSSAAAATQTYSSGSGSSPMSGKSFSGDLTYYTTGLGACGITSGYDDHIVAISEVTFDQFTPNGNPNNNPLCGQKVSITGSSGSTYEATIVDRCTGCAAADLDLSQGFFEIVEPSGDGRVHKVDWSYM